MFVPFFRSPHWKHVSKIAIVLLVLWQLFWGYKISQLSERVKTNKHSPVKLFTEDGCTIYRFYDNNLPRYYGKCEQPVTVVWEEKDKLGIGLKLSITTER